MATWQSVYRVLNDGGTLVECRGSCSRHGYWTVEQPDGRHRYEPHWFTVFFAPTPEEAIEKFIQLQRNRLAHKQQEVVEVEEQLAAALALQQSRRAEVTH